MLPHDVPGGASARDVRLGGCAAPFVAALLAVLGGTATADAQPTVEARVGGSLDRVGAAETEAQDRGSFDLRLLPEVEFGGGHARLSYTLDAGTYATLGDWSFLAQELRAVYRIDLRGERARLHLGALGTTRSNGGAWGLADFRGPAAFANLELRPSTRATVRIGYRFDRRLFAELTELDQSEHGVFASTNASFESRTTLIGELRLGSKSYAGQAVTPGVQQSQGTGSAGPGQGMGPSVRPAPASLSRESDQAQLLAVMVRVAQSLAERTGVWLQYGQRWSSGDVPPALVATPPLYLDDGVYDDPFASDATSVSGGLKHVFEGGGAVQAFGSWQRKEYRAAFALGIDGLPLPAEALRQDRITRAGCAFEQPLLAGRTGSVALSWELRYGFTRDRSNDAFYDYSSHSLGLAAGVRF